MEGGHRTYLNEQAPRDNAIVFKKSTVDSMTSWQSRDIVDRRSPQPAEQHLGGDAEDSVARAILGGRLQCRLAGAEHLGD